MRFVYEDGAFALQDVLEQVDIAAALGEEL
jgi:hypothetical protein